MSINSSTSTTNKRKRKNPSTTTPPPPTTPHPAPPRTEKRISCQRCRTRKIKCNYELPCFNCKRDGSQCIQPIDMRSKRLKATEVITLQKKLDLMIKFINDCKKLPNAEAKQQFISQTNLDELINDGSIVLDNGDSTNGGGGGGDVLHVANHDEDVTHNNSAIYGPTSVYDDSLMHNHKPNTKHKQITIDKSNSNDDNNSKGEINKDENRNVGNNSSINYNNNINTLNNRIDNNSSNLINVINKMNKDPDILKCIQLFFIWQYPDHNMFIFREAFLIDFFNPKKNMLYCSKTLILSICSLGAKMSTEETIYNRSKEFYQESKYLLLNSLHQPSITSLQSFMLLAFYDICNGQNSSGWMLSGCAMRMGYDLGFQLNPELWFVKSKGENNTINNLSKLDVEIRSRIYWGCYMADHFISLLLGRPSILKISDASIPVTSDLPDLEWIDDFTYNGYIKKKKLHKRSKSKHRKDEHEDDKDDLKSPGKHKHQEVSYISDPLNQIINLINISDNILNDIFTKTDEEQPQEHQQEQQQQQQQQQKSNEDLNLKSRWEKLSQYNSQIMAWKKNLPKDLRWNRTKLGKTGENPTYSGIRYYYYILLLCLNRPFVGIDQDNHNNHDTNNNDNNDNNDSDDNDDNLSPLSICLNAIDDLYESINRFQKKHGYRGGSIFIVYSSILSISILLLTNSRIQLASEQKNRLHFFMDVLYGCSKTWKLAEKSYNLITEKLKHLYEAGELKDVFEFIIEKKSSPSATNTSGNGLNEANGNNNNNNSQSIESNEFKLPINNKTLSKLKHNQQNTNNSLPTYDTTDTINSTSGATTTNNSTTFSMDQNLMEAPTPLSTISNGVNNNNNNGGGGGGRNSSSATDFLTDDNVDFLGGPPVLMTADLFNEDWEALFPDYIFNSKN
ncbi:hypothetical protein MGQ_02992 [Candida albicans P76067]|nr:hypothetical protein MGQ_02992 [Candida albicans P76067]